MRRLGGYPDRVVPSSEPPDPMACTGSVWQARCWQRLVGQHSSDLAFEVSRQTVRPLVVRRRDRCWDDVPRELC